MQHDNCKCRAYVPTLHYKTKWKLSSEKNIPDLWTLVYVSAFSYCCFGRLWVVIKRHDMYFMNTHTGIIRAPLSSANVCFCFIQLDEKWIHCKLSWPRNETFTNTKTGHDWCWKACWLTNENKCKLKLLLVFSSEEIETLNMSLSRYH